MEFNKSYNREEFLKFLRVDFLPEDFEEQESGIAFDNYKYTQKVTKLGVCKSLDLVVYEIEHQSTNDARVGLSKEAFRLLANEWQSRALVLFVPEGKKANYRFSLITIDLSETEDSKIKKIYSNPRRYSYLLGEEAKVHTPTQYLINKKRVIDWADLKKRFSVEVLTKEFYAELSDWYSWTISEVKFPGEGKEMTKEEKIEHKSKNMIRLLTRLLFVWFLKQKHLIPNEFFDEQYLSDKLLKDFAPNKLEGLGLYKHNDSKYYKTILQNLFFAMLNCPIKPQDAGDTRERGFRKSNHYGQHRDANYLMRYEELFKDPTLFLELANKHVPFLNGGLFDCLDNKSAQPAEYIDGFSDNLPTPHQLIVPDYLFFGEEKGKNVDLTWFYGENKKKRSVNVRGLINILETYNFTIEENTPYDQEVSLDPELLGKVFENLLASYNPETQTTARKQTGSFYTPREIVQYMVDESLIAYLNSAVDDSLEEEYRKLMHYTDEELNLSESQKSEIIKALFACKILDPACGSGAYPVGILQQMVHILAQLDPDNIGWKDIQKKEALSKTALTLDEDDESVRTEAFAEIELTFNDNLKRPDYSRKLHLIENCIYGVDLQPIAVQISKLRFFISLVVEQNATSNSDENFAIRPLPNLEAKFVAANTLIGLNKEGSLSETDNVRKEQETLKRIRHKIFSARRPETKRNLKEQDKVIREKIAQLLESTGFLDSNSADAMAKWDPYNQNISAPFFDAEWMFGEKDKFDIIIGNPPYGVSVKGNYRKQVEKHLGKVPDYEIYYYFIEVARKNVSEKGIMSYIIPNTYLFNTFAEKYRRSILENWNIIEILDCTKFPVFESATVLNTINTWQKGSSQVVGYRNTANVSNFKELIAKPRERIVKNDLLAMNQNWGLAFLLEPIVVETLEKIERASKKIRDFFGVSQGYIPYRKSDLVKEYGKTEGERIVQERLWHSEEKIDESYIQEIYGRDITKYNYQATGAYVKYGKHLACYVDIKYFNSPRLLVREITNPTIIACLIEDTYVNDPQLISIIKIEDNSLYSLPILWAILNSKLATFYHFNHSPKATKGAFPKILIQDIKDFPLPKLAGESKYVIETLVDYVMVTQSYGKINEYTTNKSLSLMFEEVIDAIVYQLYFDDLSDDLKVIELVEQSIRKVQMATSIEEQLNQLFAEWNDYNSKLRNRIILQKIQNSDIVVIEKHLSNEPN